MTKKKPNDKQIADSAQAAEHFGIFAQLQALELRASSANLSITARVLNNAKRALHFEMQGRFVDAEKAGRGEQVVGSIT